jgi:hypothetical protein
MLCSRWRNGDFRPVFQLLASEVHKMCGLVTWPLQNRFCARLTSSGLRRGRCSYPLWCRNLRQREWLRWNFGAISSRNSLFEVGWLGEWVSCSGADGFHLIRRLIPSLWASINWSSTYHSGSKFRLCSRWTVELSSPQIHAPFIVCTPMGRCTWLPSCLAGPSSPQLKSRDEMWKFSFALVLFLAQCALICLEFMPLNYMKHATLVLQIRRFIVARHGESSSNTITFGWIKNSYSKCIMDETKFAGM